jgi:hypothetical protein
MARTPPWWIDGCNGRPNGARRHSPENLDHPVTVTQLAARLAAERGTHLGAATTALVGVALTPVAAMI